MSVYIEGTLDKKFRQTHTHIHTTRHTVATRLTGSQVKWVWLGRLLPHTSLTGPGRGRRGENRKKVTKRERSGKDAWRKGSRYVDYRKRDMKYEWMDWWMRW